MDRLTDRWRDVVIGCCVVLTAFAVALSVAYLPYRLNLAVIGIMSIPVAAFGVWAHRRFDIFGERLKRERASPWRRAFAVAAIICDLALVAFLFSWRTDLPLQSPWSVVPVAGLALFAATTWMSLLLADEDWDVWTLAAMTAHGAVLFGVSELIYAYGFGFDPFIHRTAEAHIAQHGLILPKQPFYNGQYVLVVAAHWLTGLSTDLFDRVLVPFFAALTLPVFALKCIQDLGHDRLRAGWAPWIFLCIPFLPLTFTTPSNLVVLMLVWVVCLLPSIATSWRYQTLALLIAAAALVTHPLIGIVVAALAITPRLIGRFGPKFATIGGIALALVLPALFALNNLRHGDPAFIGGNPLARIGLFFDIFRSPFPILVDGRWDAWSLFYAYQAVLPWLVVALAAYGTVLLWRRKERTLPLVIWSVVLGVIGAIFLLTTEVSVPGIIGREQGEFAVRLWDACQRMLLLLCIPALVALMDRFAPPSTVRRHLALAGLALALVASWYATYPQANAHSGQIGWGVGRQHFDTVDFITQDAGAGKYVVLSDQMVSVTALRRLGFQDLPYAIPTGGHLYEYVFDIFHGRMTPDVAFEAMDEFRVDTVYVVLNDYYGGYDYYQSALAGGASEIHRLADGRVAVLTFRR